MNLLPFRHPLDEAARHRDELTAVRAFAARHPELRGLMAAIVSEEDDLDRIDASYVVGARRSPDPRDPNYQRTMGYASIRLDADNKAVDAGIDRAVNALRSCSGLAVPSRRLRPGDEPEARRTGCARVPARAGRS